MAQKYRLNALGWYNFERLVQTLLKVIIGPGVTSFGGSRDGGRDAKFKGTANYPNANTNWSGCWIFQVKFIDYEEFTSNEARSRLKREVCNELKKIIKRNRQKPDNYILITNINLTSNNRSNLNDLAIKCGHKGNFATIDGNEICEFLDIYPDIRRTYPQLLGLFDLQKLINPEIFTRSKNYYKFWSPQMGKFVQTESYVKAMNILKNNHFVVIDGPPEVGKSMIAAACAFVYATDGYQIDSIKDPKELLKIRGLDEDGNHLFIADDAVGSLTFSPGLTEKWSQEFSEIFGSLDSKNKLIWTTRRYILQEAIHKSRIGDRIETFPGIHEILVEVSKYSILQKAEILFNHAKSGKLDPFAKKIIKENAEKIVLHQNFTPERVRQLINDFIPSFYDSETDKEILDWEKIRYFLQNPSTHWEKAYDQLQVSEKNLLSAMLDFENFAKLSELKTVYHRRINGLTGTFLTFDECLDRLDHSFLKIENYSHPGKVVYFQHPSLRDLLLLKIQADDRTLLRHIEMASPIAVSEIIRGFAKTYVEKENIKHLISIHTPEQFKQLLTRIDSFSQISSSENDWNSILAALQVLVPLELNKSLESSEPLDLTKFSKTNEYEIIRVALNAFGKISTYNNCKGHSFYSWISGLKKFYYLSHFVRQAFKIEYLHNLHNGSDFYYDEELEFEFISLMAEYEPIFYRQINSDEIIESIHKYIKQKIKKKITEGNILGDENHEEPMIIKYVDWYSETDNLLAFAQSFYEFTNLKEIEDEVNFKTLDHLLTSVDKPDTETNPDISYDDYSNKDYWTISRMFEDL